MKMLKTILLFIIILTITSCGIFKKSTSSNSEIIKTEDIEKVEIIKNDSTQVITTETTKNEKDTLSQEIFHGADSVKIVITEEVTEDKTTTKKDIIVYRPVTTVTTDSKNEKNESSVIVDSTRVNKSDSTLVMANETSTTKQQEEKKSFKWSIPWYVSIIICLVVVITIINLVKKWVSGISLMDTLKKFLGITKN